MATQFEVGNLVIMQNGTVFTEFDGSLAIVVDRGRYRQAMNMITMQYEWHYLYGIRVIKEVDALSVDNDQLCVRPGQIRPLKGPDTQKRAKECLEIPATVKCPPATQ